MAAVGDDTMTEDQEDDGLRIEISPDTFLLQGKVPITKKHILYLLVLISMALGISHEQILVALGGL